MPALSRGNRKRSLKPARPSRLYAGAIVAVAVLVLGSAIWRPPVTGFRAEAVVSYRSSPDKSEAEKPLPLGRVSLDQAASAVRSLDAVRLAAKSVFPGSRNTTAETPETADNGELADIRQRVTTRGKWDEDQQTSRVTVAFEDPDRDDAQRFVNELAGQFVKRCNRQADEAKQQLSEQLKLASAKKAEIRSRLDSLALTHEQLTKRSSKVPQTETPVSQIATPPDTPTNATPAKSAADAGAEEPLNPDWISLRDYVAQLEDRRTTLAATRTEVHPQMLEVVAEIEEFSAVLARTPKYVESNDSRLAGSAITEQDAAESLALTFPLLTNDPPGVQLDEAEQNNSENDTVSPKAVEIATGQTDQSRELSPLETVDHPARANGSDEIASIKHQYDLARAEFVRTERKERELKASVGLLGTPLALLETPARGAEKIGGQLSASRLLQLLGAALALGAIVAMTLPSLKKDRVVHHVSDAEDLLGIPAIGSLSGDGSAAKSAGKLSIRRGAVRLITTAAEFSLIAVVVFFVTALLLDRSVAAAYIDDPVHAVHQTLDLAKQRLGGG